MFFAKGQKEPAMFEDIQGRTEIPEWWHDESDVFRDPLEFIVKSGWILDVFYRVGTQRMLELICCEWKMIDVIHDDEIRDLGMLHDIHIDAAAVRLSTADVEIPDLAAMANDSSKNAVADPIEEGE